MPFQLKVSSVVFGEGPLCCESNLQMRCEGYGPYTYIEICLWPLPLALPLACAFDLCSLPSPLDLPFASGFRRCLPWPLHVPLAFAVGRCLWPLPLALPLAVPLALALASAVGPRATQPATTSSNRATAHTAAASVVPRVTQPATSFFNRASARAAAQNVPSPIKTPPLSSPHA